MEINIVKTSRLPIMGGVELKSATFFNKSFPLHFHKFWSLGFIEAGSEFISFNNADLLLSKHAQILIPPYSLHKNWGAENTTWTYKTIYINSESIRTIAKEFNFDYAELASFPYFINYGNENIEVTENSILKILKNLFFSSRIIEPYSNFTASQDLHLDELLDYLSLNYNLKVTLQSLEQRFKINKYKLLRDFKSKVGISPLEYQMSIRIEKSKQLFFDGTPLTHIALESGFFDQSHFSHNFKKYVGVTPGDFRSNCNILQDQGSFLT